MIYKQYRIIYNFSRSDSPSRHMHTYIDISTYPYILHIDITVYCVGKSLPRRKQTRNIRMYYEYQVQQLITGAPVLFVSFHTIGKNRRNIFYDFCL